MIPVVGEVWADKQYSKIQYKILAVVDDKVEWEYFINNAINSYKSYIDNFTKYSCLFYSLDQMCIKDIIE